MLPSAPMYRLAVDTSITSTVVSRMQMEARPAPLRRIRNIMEDTETKWFAL